jgi:hypothetical protein
LNKNLPDNFVSNPKKILRKVMSKAESSHDLCLGRYNSANLTSMFEVMANKTLHEYSAPTQTTFVLVRQSLWETQL